MKRPSRKEIGVWTVACWVSTGLAVLLSVFSGIVTIQAGQLFVGLLFFVVGIVVAIPRRYLRLSKALRVTIFILAYFTLIVISGLNAPKPEQQYEYYALGQSFNLTVGNTIYSMKIDNISKETSMIVNDGQNLSSAGFYLFVNGEITNLGKVTSDSQFTSELRDGEDNIYKLFATDTRVGGLQPNLEKKFYHVFEIPRQASGLKLYVKDSTAVMKVVNLE